MTLNITLRWHKPAEVYILMPIMTILSEKCIFHLRKMTANSDSYTIVDVKAVYFYF